MTSDPAALHRTRAPGAEKRIVEAPRGVNPNRLVGLDAAQAAEVVAAASARAALDSVIGPTLAAGALDSHDGYDLPERLI